MKNTELIATTISEADSFNVDKIREDFPILNQKIRGKPLVYLDNAATSQKPKVVIDTIQKYYYEENSNIHRGVHYLSERVTEKYEAVREKIRSYINAKQNYEIIFVSGTTAGINLIANTFGNRFIKSGDEILISALEHHSNIVPWQILCEQKGARLRVIPMNENGDLLIDEYENLLNEKTKLVAITHVSNALGTVNPIKAMVKIAHQREIPVLIDGAQAIPHLRVDVNDLDCDFYVFSGHKVFGPTGIGVLYGKEKWLHLLPPYQGGGDMIKFVSFEKTVYNDLPHKFEAGTPHIAGVIGLGSAIDYLRSLDFISVFKHEDSVLKYAIEKLSEIKRVKIIGTPKERLGVISFIIEGVHPHDVGTILDYEGIAIRAGHHCAQPVMQFFGLSATARASFAFYNKKEEVDSLISAIYKVMEVFG